MLHSAVTEERVFNNQGQFKLRYSRRQELIALAGFAGLCLSEVLALGVLAAGWTPAPRAPAMTPPGFLYFGACVTVDMMSAIAAWEIWRAPDVSLRNTVALRAWGWQLGMKALWASLFFGLHWRLAGLAAGAATLGILSFTMARFSRLNRDATLLMAPYAAWAVFQLYLNAGFWILNH